MKHEYKQKGILDIYLLEILEAFIHKPVTVTKNEKKCNQNLPEKSNPNQ